MVCRGDFEVQSDLELSSTTQGKDEWSDRLNLSQKKKQLDFDMSPPANIMTFRLTLTQVSFDLDLCDPGFSDWIYSGSWDLIFF